ncbi:egl nine homolog 1 [Exaiptasia diaphana]|uniref:hypoxia-inducible factor-proline dioxygenase n=1 Tax=Exaiptasia diaphana TaxID=2652724 RepID=A0A913XEY7_EXADI|nr:egl nine homolog 1 [Exaiptasia diaphana]
MICTKVKEGPNSLSNAFQIDSAKIADFVCYELNKNGFCILNDFLSVTASESILHEVITLDNTGIFKDGQLSGGLTSSENAEKYSEKKIRGDRITWVEGKEHNVNNIREIYMSKVDDLVLQCNGTSRKLGGYDIQGRTKAMVACYPGQQTGYIKHVDNPDGDGRCLTVLFYLNKGWTEENGGKLRIFKTNRNYDVEPLFNRLVLFWSDMRTPHEVLPSNSIRYAITMWYFDKEQREHAKQLQKHKMMGEFGFEVMIKDLESKKNERDQAQKKLDEESERLVKSMMTDEDLDAMSELIKGHDDPRAILGMYGISPSILDALLRVLSKRT